MSDQVTPEQVTPEQVIPVAVAVAPTGDDGPTPRLRTGDDRGLPDDTGRESLDAERGSHNRRDRRAAKSAGRMARPSAVDGEADRVIARLVVADELSSLPADQRRMLEKACNDDLAHVQIGVVTGVPLGMVTCHRRRGLTRLKPRWEVDDASRPRSAGAAGAG